MSKPDPAAVDALTASLLELANEPRSTRQRKRKSDEKPRAPKPAPPPPVEVDHRQRLYAHSKWTDERVVTLMIRTKCSCGMTYIAPGPHPMLQRFHPRYGLHLEALTKFKPERHRDLPWTIRYEEHHVSGCHVCLHRFDPVRTGQLSFEFTDEERFQQPGRLYRSPTEAQKELLR